MNVEIDERDAQKIALKVAALLKEQFGGAGETNGIMDVEALASYLKVKADWLYKQVQYKSIPHFKAGKLVRFRKSEIDAWIAQRSLPVTRSVYPSLKSRRSQQEQHN